MSRARRVIAFARRGRILLGAIEDAGPPLRVVAEGGGQLKIDAADVLREFSLGAEGGTPKELGRDLRLRRLAGGETVDLELLWESAAGREVASLDDLVGMWFDETSDDGALALIRSLDGALPWFELGPGGLHRLPREKVEEERRRREAEERALELEMAVIAWLEAGAAGSPPEGGAEVLGELRRLALRGAEGSSKRAIRIARKVGCPEPDDLLERLEIHGHVPLHVDPGPVRHGVPVEFPDGLTASFTATDAAAGARVDLTGQFTIALDDPDTVEVDDALSWEEAEDGILLHVHIADAAARIPPGSPLDVEAARRSRTVYEPDRRVPMLPPEVVPHLSLEEGEARAAITGTFHVLRDGEVRSATFRRTTVRVDRRSGYDLEDLGLLGPMSAAAEALRARRVAAGAICLDLPDAKILVADGVPRVKIREPVSPADHVVAEAAVLYNRAVADLLHEHGVPGIFRGQEKLEEPLPGPEDPLRTIRARRMLPPATSSVDPVRHHGVAADAYLTATSPIRRYVDLLHQRQIAAVLEDRPAPYGRPELEAMVEEVAGRERRARLVEAERTSYWLGRILEARVGETLDGVVSRVMAAGRIGVWIEEILREQTLKLAKSHPRVAEGDPIRVRVTRVRPRRGSVHLETATEIER